MSVVKRICSRPAGRGGEAGPRRGEMHGAAVRRLRAMIMTGVLPPGARLREVELAADLGFSRTPIREAFRTLAGEGLVELLPNRSVVVAKLRAPDIEHLYHVMAALEGLAGELACARITNAEVAEIGQLLSQMVDLHQQGDRVAYMALNQAIHRRVVEIAGNPILEGQWRALLPRVERARALANLDHDRWRAALLEHSKMFAALAARDGPLFARLVREHFMNGLALPIEPEIASPMAGSTQADSE